MSKYLSMPFLILSCVSVLSACSMITDGSTQQVSFKAVGAEDSFCDIQTGVNDYRYNVRPPQTIWVQRSRKPMFISCTAPGNRMQNVTVQSQVAGKTFLNALNAGLGAGVDATTGAMFKYPDEVIIDFSTALTREQPLPSYENKGALNPQAQGIEYLGPDTPELGGDKALAARYKAAYADAARLEAEDAAAALEKQRRIDSLDGGFYGDKGAPHSGGDILAPQTQSSPSKDVVIPVVPKANPQLGKPIFPSSTSF